MEEYYRKRALEFEEVYHRDDPWVTKELEEVSAVLQKFLTRRNVLEVACGTGYWTQHLSHTAKTITAVDIAQEMLRIARTKSYACPVRLQTGDAYALPFDARMFGGGLASFWLSHIPLDRIDAFLAGFHAKLRQGSPIFMVDNVYVPGLGGELIRKDGDMNTYKMRELKDGTKHLVVKNYFSKDNLMDIVQGPRSRGNIEEIHIGKNYWFVAYRI